MIEVILETECPNETEAIIRRAASGAPQRGQADGCAQFSFKRRGRSFRSAGRFLGRYCNID